MKERDLVSWRWNKKTIYPSSNINENQLTHPFFIPEPKIDNVVNSTYSKIYELYMEEFLGFIILSRGIFFAKSRRFIIKKILFCRRPPLDFCYHIFLQISIFYLNKNVFSSKITFFWKFIPPAYFYLENI